MFSFFFNLTLPNVSISIHVSAAEPNHEQERCDIFLLFFFTELNSTKKNINNTQYI